MSEGNDPHAEALLLVQQAIRTGEAQGVDLDAGVFAGMITPLGRLVLFVDLEQLSELGMDDAPTFDSPEAAAAWIVVADREDGYALHALQNAITNWRRNADKSSNVDHLLELGNDLVRALSALARGNAFDDSEDW